MQTATLSLFRFEGAGARLWVLGQMAAARPGLMRLPGLEFFKLCGSGTGEGFTPRPNWAVWAILGVWRDEEAARDGIAAGDSFRRWRARARESVTFHLRPISTRGKWSGREPFRPDAETGSQGAAAGPVVALTRATVRPHRVLRFWRRSPDISARIGADRNVLFKIGIGEVPLLHQVTFSIWPDTASMAAFARTGAHADAIRAVREEGWFGEELYARFRLTGCEGQWQGKTPLASLDRTEAA